MWIIASLVALALMFWYFGWRWESTLRRPSMAALAELPLVSILIPAYMSEATISDAINSAKGIDYPRKEIMVVNDSKDRTPDICRSLGVKCIQNEKRMGKCHALNAAVKKARGDILFFLDSDTKADRDCLNRMVPWFSDPKIGAVSPKFSVLNKSTNWLTRMAGLEHYFLNSFFKIHMYFGSLVSFWGFGVAVRKDAFQKLDGWSNTLLEDADFAAKLLEKGYSIQYEPSAFVSTMQPETVSDLRKQRFRWGKGSMFTFFNHRSIYKGNAQFTLYFIPYILLAFAVISLFMFQTASVFIPFISLWVLYTFSMKEFLLLIGFIVLPMFATTITTVAAGSLAHVAIMSYPEKQSEVKARDIAWLIPYVCAYVPMIMAFYIKGAISGIRDRRHSRSELCLNDW
jgi:cellulose synthase/poly-beta-1,6-N-acetylglucosamine synthase-like glycosyltransferase